MKKIKFMSFLVIIAVFLIFSCEGFGEKGLNQEESGVINSIKFIGYANAVDNLLEKYNLSTRSDWFIWNDYMPGWGWELTPEGDRASIVTISFDSPVKLPDMEVFATIITERITIPVLLYDIYNVEGTYGLLYRKDFRPVNSIRLNDGEEYTLEVIVKIDKEYQILIFENQKVYITH